MLHHVSWQQYMTAVILLSAAWYGWVLFSAYRPKPKAVPPMTAVMGAVKADAGTGLHEPGELRFSAASPDDISDGTLPKGPGDELLEEAQTLITAYRDHDDKTSFLSLFKILLDKYAGFADEISLPAVIHSLQPFAETHLPFTLEADEWPLTFDA